MAWAVPVAIGASGCSESRTPDDITFDAAGDREVRDAPPDVDELVVCGDPDSLTTPLDPDERRAFFDGCERFLGSVSFSDRPVVSPEIYRTVQIIEGFVNFLRNNELRSMDGFDSLRVVEGRFVIRNAPVLTDLRALGNLERIGGRLELESNWALESLEGLQRLESIGALTWINGGEVSPLELTGLREIRGDVRIRSVPRADVEAFLSQVRVDGEIDVTYPDE
ncbi:MAG: hypothetical protein AAGF12_19885 [Myxococcota bacterium]